MIRRLLIVLPLLFVSHDLLAQGTHPLVGTRWHLEAFETDTSGVTPVIAEHRPSMSFSGSSDRMNPGYLRLGGSDGCNGYFGAYRIGQGDTLSVGYGATTLLACSRPAMLQAHRFQLFVNSMAHYDHSPARLTLYSPDRRMMLRFARPSPRIRLVNLLDDGGRGITMSIGDSNYASTVSSRSMSALMDVQSGERTVAITVEGTTAPLFDSIYSIAPGRTHTLVAYRDRGGNARAVLLEDAERLALESPHTAVRVLSLVDDVDPLAVRTESSDSSRVSETASLHYGGTLGWGVTNDGFGYVKILGRDGVRVIGFVVDRSIDEHTVVLTGSVADGDVRAWSIADEDDGASSPLLELRRIGDGGGSLRLAAVPAVSSVITLEGRGFVDTIRGGEATEHHSGLVGQLWLSVQRGLDPRGSGMPLRISPDTLTTGVYFGNALYEVTYTTPLNIDVPTDRAMIQFLPDIGGVIDAWTISAPGFSYVSDRVNRIGYMMLPTQDVRVRLVQRREADSIVTTFAPKLEGGVVYTMILTGTAVDVMRASLLVDSDPRSHRLIDVPRDSALSPPPAPGPPGSMRVVNLIGGAAVLEYSVDSSEIIRVPTTTATVSQSLASGNHVAGMVWFGPNQRAFQQSFDVRTDLLTTLIVASTEHASFVELHSDSGNVDGTATRARVLNATDGSDHMDISLQQGSDSIGLGSVRHRIVSDYRALRAGTLRIEGIISGRNPEAPYINAQATLVEGHDYTIVLTGSPIRPVAFLLDDSDVAEQRPVRRFGAAASSPAPTERAAISFGPNPASEWIAVSGVRRSAVVELVDVRGNVRVAVDAQSPRVVIGCDDIAAGVYAVRVREAAEISTVGHVVVVR